jgi:hypothetical protein
LKNPPEAKFSKRSFTPIKYFSAKNSQFRIKFALGLGLGFFHENRTITIIRAHLLILAKQTGALYEGEQGEDSR